MHVLSVQLQIRPEPRDAFIPATTEEAHDCLRHESGCLRFHVLEDGEDRKKVTLDQVYGDVAAMGAHQEMLHFKKYRDDVPPMYATPVTRFLCKSVFPAGAAWW